MNQIILHKERHFLFFMSIFISIIFISKQVDNDIWFLLSDGRYVMNYGIPSVDPLSMHDGLHFVMQQWLSAFIFWKIYSFLGETGLILLVHFIGASIIYAYYRLLLYTSDGNQSLAVLETVLLSIIPCIYFFVTRPQIFSLFIFILTILLLEKTQHNISKKQYFSFFILSCLLINLHAAMWPLILIFPLTYLAEKKCKTNYFLHQVNTSWREYTLLLLVLFIGGLLNPYGIEAMMYTFNSYGIDTINCLVGEMHPITFDNIIGKIFFILMGLLIAQYSRKKAPLHFVLLSIGMTYLALSSFRSLNLFLFIGCFPLAFFFRSWKGFSFHSDSSLKVNRKFCTIIIFLIFLLYGYSFYNSKDIIQQDIRQIPIITKAVILTIITIIISIERKYGSLKHSFIKTVIFIILLLLTLTSFNIYIQKEISLSHDPISKRAVEYILTKENHTNVVIWTGYNQGGYAEFRGLRPYIDTRAEVFIKANNHQKDILKEYMEMIKQEITYKELLSRYDFEYILTTKDEIMYNYLKDDPEYELVLEYEGKDFGKDSSVRLYKPIKRRKDE